MAKNRLVKKHPPQRSSGKQEAKQRSSGQLKSRETGKIAHAELLLKIQTSMAASDKSVELGEKWTTMDQLALEAASEFYQQLAPKDALEAILVGLTVGLSNATMECFADAASWRSYYPRVRDINLRNGIRGAKTTAELIKQLDERRARISQGESIEKANGEAGGERIECKVDRRPHAQQAMYEKFQMGANGKTPKTVSGKNLKDSGWL